MNKKRATRDCPVLKVKDIFTDPNYQDVMHQKCYHSFRE